MGLGWRQQTLHGPVPPKRVDGFWRVSGAGFPNMDRKWCPRASFQSMTGIRKIWSQHKLESVQYIFPLIKDRHCQPILFIWNLWSQSILKLLPMSLSSLSLDVHRKHKATERAESNGDPLVARKKAQDASKLATSSLTPSQGPATSKSVPKILKVSQSYCWG
jgi:hypothetical protein